MFVFAVDGLFLVSLAMQEGGVAADDVGVDIGRSIKDSESSAGSENLAHFTAATGTDDLLSARGNKLPTPVTSSLGLSPSSCRRLSRA